MYVCECECVKMFADMPSENVLVFGKKYEAGCKAVLPKICVHLHYSRKDESFVDKIRYFWIFVVSY